MVHLQTKFDRASRSYEDHSQVQRRMAKRLAELLPDSLRPTSILELACGTGHLTERLTRRFPEVPLLATDASEGMIAVTAGKFAASDSVRTARLDVLCDLESGLRRSRADLLASAALVQWLPDLRRHFAAVAEGLPRGGCYALSAFCKSNFPELNTLLEAPPFGYRDFPGHFLSEACATAEACGFEVRQAVQEDEVVVYPTARAFLAMIKGTGAVRPPEKPPSRERAVALLRGLEERLTDSGLPITWKPWYLVLQKSGPGSRRG